MHLLVFLRSLYLCSDEESKSRKKKEHKVYVLFPFQDITFWLFHCYLRLEVNLSTKLKSNKRATLLAASFFYSVQFTYQHA